MKIVGTALGICCFVVLSASAGCAASEPITIDSEADSTFMSTYKAMKSSLDVKDKVKLTSAMLAIGLQGVGSVEERQQKYPNGFTLSAVKDKVDGLSFEEILLLAEQSDIQIEAYPVDAASETN